MFHVFLSGLLREFSDGQKSQWQQKHQPFLSAVVTVLPKAMTSNIAELQQAVLLGHLIFQVSASLNLGQNPQAPQQLGSSVLFSPCHFHRTFFHSRAHKTFECCVVFSGNLINNSGDRIKGTTLNIQNEFLPDVVSCL